MTDQSKPHWLPDVYDPAEFSHDKQGFRWRCNGAPGCEGWVGLGLGSEDAARREYDRHVSEEHLARTSPDNPVASGDGATCGYVKPHLPHQYMRLEVLSECPSVPAASDDGLREQIAAALEAADYRQGMRRGDLADAILPVVNRRMEQLAAERDQSEDAARRFLVQRQEMAAERYAWQERGDRAEAAIARVRALAADIRADANQMTATEADNLRIIADHLTAALDAPAGEVTP